MRNKPWLAFPLSVLLAFVLLALPLPTTLAYWRPDWVAMVLVFWVLNESEWIGVWTAFFIGLVVDVETASVLGEHSLMLAVVVYLTRLSSRWVGVFSLWQTAALVFLLVATELLIKIVIQKAQGEPMVWTAYGVPALSSAMIWPFVALALRPWNVAIR